MGDLKVMAGEKAKKRKKAQEDGEDKPTAYELQAMIAHYVNNTAANPVGAPPLREFIILSPDNVKKLVYQVTTEKEVFPSDEDAVTHMIGESVESIFKGDRALELPINQIKQCSQFWYNTTPVKERPPLLSWSDEDHLVFRRIPFKNEIGDTPLFDEMMNRITNSTALMAFIGSLLDEESDLQQYVWLHGQGGDGKGALTRFLANVFGRLFSSQQPPGKSGGNFWTHGIKDKRLVVFPDCNDHTFVTTGLFKSLSGGDPVRIEVKNGGVWTQVIAAKYLFVSNERPDVSSEKADLRRIIYCEMKNFDGEQDPGYEAKLWKEGGYFLGKCLALYRALCPNGGKIPAESEAAQQLSHENEEIYASFFDNNFNLTPNTYTLASDFQPLLKNDFKSKIERKMFSEWLKRTHNILSKSEWVDGKKTRVYRGMSIKINVFNQTIY